jgi:fructose-specific phosphotransferase system IIC component
MVSENPAARIGRSAATIAVYGLLGPLFGAGFIFGISEKSLDGFFVGIVVAFYAAPFVAIWAIPIGLIPALMTGCLAALVSPVTTSSFRYVLYSVVFGAATTGIFMSVFLAWDTRFAALLACGAFAGLCCALISATFRSRPTVTEPACPSLQTR